MFIVFRKATKQRFLQSGFMVFIPGIRKLSPYQQKPKVYLVFLLHSVREQRVKARYPRNPGHLPSCRMGMMPRKNQGEY